jgi:hypothetical protein
VEQREARLEGSEATGVPGGKEGAQPHLGGRARRAAWASPDLAPTHKRPHQALGAVVGSVKAGHTPALTHLALVAQQALGQGRAGRPPDARVDHSEPESLCGALSWRASSVRCRALNTLGPAPPARASA